MQEGVIESRKDKRRRRTHDSRRPPSQL